MSKLPIIIFLAGSAAVICSAQPNFIIIMTDDQMHSEIGYTGGDVHTPTIDALAEGGLGFTNAYVSSTVCAPARYTSLTGRYAGRNTSERFLSSDPEGELSRIENVNINMETDGMNLQTLLKTQGYTTGMVGKWHLGFNPDTPDSITNFASYSQTADPKSNQQVNSAMQENHRKLCAAIRDMGWDYAGSMYKANLKELNNDHLNVNNIDWTVKGALDFLDQAGDNPFFLYFSTTLNHGPHPGALVGGKMVNGVDADPRYTGEGYLSNPLDVMPSRADINSRVADAGKAYRTAFATWLDDAVGALQSKLRLQGKEENTLIIYQSDHGKDRYGKSTLFYGGVHVPMFASWKGTITPGQTDELVQNIDIAATFYDYADITLPEGYQMDGRTLRPFIEGDMNAEIHPSLFFEIGYARAVMTKEYKYIAVRYPPDVQAQIDRGEQFNGWQGELLDYPYLLNNSHLGHYSSAQNPHYFDLDQIYDMEQDLVDENNNILYDDNGNPIPDGNLSQQVKDLRNEMQELLTVYLERFPNRPFGDLYDGVPVSVSRSEQSGSTMMNAGEELLPGQRIIHGGKTFFISEQVDGTWTVYDYAGRTCRLDRSTVINTGGKNNP